MAWTEDPTDFLADFGVPVVAGATEGFGIFDTPGEYVADGRAITTEYLLRVEASKFGNLTYNDALTVAGLDYTVREAPLPIDDGVFCLVLLTRNEHDLLLEDGFNLLQEDGFKIYMEA